MSTSVVGAQKNKDYLEQKHSIIWERRREKPIVSFVRDIEFALKQAKASAEQPTSCVYTKDTLLTRSAISSQSS
jgi:hypothetical protein